MPSFKKKNTNKEMAKRANLIAKILDDNRELTDSLKEHTELRNTLKNYGILKEHTGFLTRNRAPSTNPC